MALVWKGVKPSRSDDSLVPASRSTDQLLASDRQAFAPDAQFFMPRGAKPLEQRVGVAASPVPRSMPDKILPLAAVGGAGVLFAIQALIMKQASTLGAGTFEVVAVRGAIQASAVIIILTWNGHVPLRHWCGVTWPQRRIIFVRALVGFASTTLSFASYHYLPIGDATSIQFISPIFSIIVSWLLLNEGVTGLECASIFGTMIGVTLVSRPPFLFGHGHQLSTLGVWLSVLGALATGVVVVLIRKLAKQLHPGVVLLSQGLGQALLAPLAIPLLGRHWVAPNAELWMYMWLMGLTSLAAQLLFTFGLARERVGPANAMLSLQLLAAFVFQVIFTPNEPVHPLSIVGSLVIASSVLVVVLQSSRNLVEKPAEAPERDDAADSMHGDAAAALVDEVKGVVELTSACEVSFETTDAKANAGTGSGSGMGETDKTDDGREGDDNDSDDDADFHRACSSTGRR